MLGEETLEVVALKLAAGGKSWPLRASSVSSQFPLVAIALCKASGCIRLVCERIHRKVLV